MVAKDLVLLGGGHSHVEVLRAFGQITQQRHRKSSHPPHGSTPSSATEGRQQSAPAPASGNLAAANAGAAAGTAPVKHPNQRVSDSNQTRTQTPNPNILQNHRLTLISRGRFTPYSGMLPGWASGFYSYGDCHIDLQQLASYAGARLVVGEANEIDIWARTVRFDDNGGLPYDVLSIDVGITPGSSTVPGADRLATPVKPIDGFVQRYERLLEGYRRAAVAAVAAAAAAGTAAGTTAKAEGGSKGTVKPLMRVCVVGGGAGGVELAAAVRYRLEEERRRGGWDADLASVSVSLLCRGGLLPGHPPHVRRLVRHLLTQRGVHVRRGDAVVGVEPGELRMESGGRVPYDECLWCTEASPAAWLRATGLPTDSRGFLAVNEHLQSDGGPSEVFAAGDVASCAAHPRPKAGVFAVRQGPPLAANLRSFLEGQPLRPFVPQEAALALISLGDRFCVASRTGGREHGRRRQRPRRPPRGAPAANGSPPGRGVADEGDADGDSGDEWPLGWLLNGFGGVLVGLTGPVLWRWKDSIDRAFMRRYGADLTV